MFPLSLTEIIPALVFQFSSFLLGCLRILRRYSFGTKLAKWIALGSVERVLFILVTDKSRLCGESPSRHALTNLSPGKPGYGSGSSRRQRERQGNYLADVRIMMTGAALEF